ncbi:MAG TPA: serine/threonine-protein kinase, partial [Pirellulaceae bacterium]
MSSTLHILRPHARGGLGEVTVALDEQLRREVAFKEMHSQFAKHDDTRKRFLREAEVTGRLEHPGIVPVYGMGQFPDGRPFYAMRFIKGPTLKDAAERFHAAERQPRPPAERSLALRELLNRFLTVCDAISYAHSRNVLHRDLKPGNILLGEYGETLVVDWGLAKYIVGDDDSSLGEVSSIASPAGDAATVELMRTRVGRVVGTPQFMSPEQANGQIGALGPATDIYALGATLYVILTGRPPIERGSNDAMLADVRLGRWLRPREINSRIPRPLESICVKAMALEASDRFDSVGRLAEDIRRWLADAPVSSHQETLAERLARLGRKHRSLVRSAAAALAILALVSCGFAVALNVQRKVAVRAASAERAAREEMQIAKERKDRVLKYLTDAFRRPDPSVDGRSVTVASVLDQARREVDLLDKDPEEQSLILSTLGETYFSLGLYPESKEVTERALKMRRSVSPSDAPETMALLHNLALNHASTGEFDRAIALLRDVFDWRRREQGIDHVHT